MGHWEQATASPHDDCWASYPNNNPPTSAPTTFPSLQTIIYVGLRVFWFCVLVLSFVVIKIVQMDAWRARLGEARQAFLDDDEDDKANMEVALDQLEDLINTAPTVQGIAGGSCERKRANIGRAKVIVDERMYLDYFAESPVCGPTFFQCCYCMRRSLFLTILERVCACNSYFLQKRMLVAWWVYPCAKKSQSHCGCLHWVCAQMRWMTMTGLVSPQPWSA